MSENESRTPSLAAELIYLVQHARTRKAIKPWGEEAVIELNEVLLKVITVNAGHRTSLQLHREKHEVIAVIDGAGYVMTQEHDGEQLNERFTYAGSIIMVPPNTVHRTVGPVTLLEITTPQDDDVVRLTDDYGRAGNDGV